jgi:asparagine synthase (glutamine-hydrolysing)
MCGINGFNFQDDNLIKRMMSLTKNRGPDFSDYISKQDITLGHDRLSILDLNNRSNQPFKFKHLIISYNGEIFNYIELKKELISHGYKFKTTSDTEVIIYLFDKFGIESFKKLSGIFAISLWDDNKKILYLIRDIVGVKPLYYFSENEKNLIFSSSIKSIFEYKKINQINSKALFFYKNI